MSSSARSPFARAVLLTIAFVAFGAVFMTSLPSVRAGGWKDELFWVAWSLSPVLLGAVLEFSPSLRGVLEGEFNMRGVSGSAFGIAAGLVVAFGHFAWAADWRGLATGSSTAGLGLVFIPIWAIGVGIVVGMIAFWLQPSSAAKRNKLGERARPN